EKAQRAAKSKNGEYRSVLKAAERDGVCKDGILAYYADAKRDAIEVALEHQTKMRVATLKENKALQLAFELKMPEIENPFLAGQQVGREAGDIRECKYTPGSADFDLWHQGYKSGQDENMQRFAEGSAAEQPPA